MLDARIPAQRGEYIFLNSSIDEQGLPSGGRVRGECTDSVRRRRMSGHHPLCMIEGQSRKACDDSSPDAP
jgi:hypothetical protein